MKDDSVQDFYEITVRDKSTNTTMLIDNMETWEGLLVAIGAAFDKASSDPDKLPDGFLEKIEELKHIAHFELSKKHLGDLVKVIPGLQVFWPD